jgi:hypothetical protein
MEAKGTYFLRKRKLNYAFASGCSFICARTGLNADLCTIIHLFTPLNNEERKQNQSNHLTPPRFQLLDRTSECPIQSGDPHQSCFLP